MPRNRLMVPMVITMEERFSRVTSRPLISPHSNPTLSPTPTSVGVGQPACAQNPMIVELSAMVDATDKSISRAIISIAIGSTMMAFSVKLNVASDRFQIFRKYGEARAPATNTNSVTASKKPSQHIRRRSNGITDIGASSRRDLRDINVLFMIWPQVQFAQHGGWESGAKSAVLSVCWCVR